jgi:hypothetical protein
LVNLSEAPAALRPIVAAIDDWNRDWRLGVIFECGVGPGRLLVCVLPLRDPTAPPGARQLLHSLLDYMGTAAFHPTVVLEPDQVGRLWARAAAGPAPTRVWDPDLDDGSAKPAH